LKAKGIFCLEGDWWNDLKTPNSLEPILTLLNHWWPYHVPVIHRDVEARQSLQHYLKKWAQNRYADYPILYLPFHGDTECLTIGDKRVKANTITLDDFEEMLAGNCHRRIIFFGGCGVLDTHGLRLRRFMRNTGALAVCGYTNYVDWLESTAFELMALGIMQRNAFTKSGAAAIKRKIMAEVGGLAKRQGFRMEIAK
jgi:hypothetical protein